MLTCILAACVGLAGDGWSYSRAEAKSGTAKPAIARMSSGAPGGFEKRSVAKFVEHTSSVPTPAPAPEPTVQPSPEHVRPSPQSPVDPAPVNPVVQKQWWVMPDNPSMEAYGYVDENRVLRYEAMRPRPEAPRAVGPKNWHVLPEDATMEGYGWIDVGSGVATLRYERLRPRFDPWPPPGKVVRIDNLNLQQYYRRPVPISHTYTSVMCLPSGGGS